MRAGGKVVEDENGYVHCRGGSFELRSRDASLAAVKNHVSLAFMRLVDHSGEVDRGERCHLCVEEEEEPGEDEGAEREAEEAE